MKKNRVELWRGEFGRRMSEGVVRRQELPHIEVFWGDPNQDGPVNFGNCTDIYVDGINERGYGEGKYDVVRLYMYDAALPKMDPAKMPYILAAFKRFANVLQPTYAAFGHDEDAMKARKGKDILKFGWGGMVFGPELVKQIGRDRILASEQLLVKENLPWGGIWTQAWANPFVVSKEWMRLVEQELGLKKLEFPGQQAVASKGKKASN